MGLRTFITGVFIYAIAFFWGSVVALRCLYTLIKGPLKFINVQKRSEPPACLSDPTLGTHGFVRTENGLRFHYVANGDEAKPLMLLLHGFPECWYSWRHQLRAFSNDYRVVAVDTRGYGESDKPTRVEEYNLKEFVEDVRQIIIALGYEKCTLVGHDWGGVMTWATAQKYPDMMEKVIIMNCPNPGVFAPYLRSHPVQLLKSWYMFFFQLPYFPEFVWRRNDLVMLDATFRGRKMGVKNRDGFTKGDVEAFKYYLSQPGALTPPINYIRAGLWGGVTGKSLRDNARSPVKAPLLLIWGTEDGALELEMAHLSKKYSEDFTLHLIHGASHWVQQDAVDDVIQCMRDFLQRET